MVFVFILFYFLIIVPCSKILTQNNEKTTVLTLIDTSSQGPIPKSTTYKASSFDISLGINKYEHTHLKSVDFSGTLIVVLISSLIIIAILAAASITLFLYCQKCRSSNSTNISTGEVSFMEKSRPLPDRHPSGTCGYEHRYNDGQLNFQVQDDYVSLSTVAQPNRSGGAQRVEYQPLDVHFVFQPETAHSESQQGTAAEYSNTYVPDSIPFNTPDGSYPSHEQAERLVLLHPN